MSGVNQDPDIQQAKEIFIRVYTMERSVRSMIMQKASRESRIAGVTEDVVKQRPLKTLYDIGFGSGGGNQILTTMCGVDGDLEDALSAEFSAMEALALVVHHLHAMEESIFREIEKLEPEMDPEIVAVQLKICYELRRIRFNLQLTCRRLYGVGEQICMETLNFNQCLRMENHSLRLATSLMFNELVKVMDRRELDNLHKQVADALMVYDPKRKASVPSRFCSFHLAGFDLDEKSTTQLGPPYERFVASLGMNWTRYVTGNEQYELAEYCTEVVSIRVVKVGPSCTYPVKVYGKVIARDEIDYNCVYLFDRERKDAQTISSEEASHKIHYVLLISPYELQISRSSRNSSASAQVMKDMLALKGPYRALVTLGFMYFEFDLKTKGDDDPDEVVQFSKGVIPYFCKAGDCERSTLQLPSFQSTVKLVLEDVGAPVAASLEVSVVEGDPLVHFDGKITAGTSKNYRQHMVLYDSSVPPSEGLLREDGSLVLNRNLIAVSRCERDREFELVEKLVLYVCFLDGGCEIEDEDPTYSEPEDVDDGDDEGDEDDPEDDGDGDGEGDVDGDEEEEGEEPKNVVKLKYPGREGVWEYGCPKLKVKVKWTAILDRHSDFFLRHSYLPKGYSVDYRWGGKVDE